MKKAKICLITAARSDYSPMRWLLEELKNDETIDLSVIVTGSHLSPMFGNTVEEIENDGFLISYKVEMLLSSNTSKGLVKATGLAAIGFSDVFEDLKPDIIVVLGDRYELLPIVTAALIMNIKIAHISGGDITEGAIDNQIRNAVSMMSSIHFPGTKESADRLIRMGLDEKTIFSVGEPGLDGLNRIKTLNREELASILNINKSKQWILLTYHPETNLSLESNLKRIENILHCLESLDNTDIIITYANADFGGNQINYILKKLVNKNPTKYHLFENLGQVKYISLLKQLQFMIGNSSSGIIEAPSIPIPVINIGDRQKGRLKAENVIDVNGTKESIAKALNIIKEGTFSLAIQNIINPYGDGDSSIRIKEFIKQYIKQYIK